MGKCPQLFIFLKEKKTKQNKYPCSFKFPRAPIEFSENISLSDFRIRPGALLSGPCAQSILYRSNSRLPSGRRQPHLHLCKLGRGFQRQSTEDPSSIGKKTFESWSESRNLKKQVVMRFPWKQCWEGFCQVRDKGMWTTL